MEHRHFFGRLEIIPPLFSGRLAIPVCCRTLNSCNIYCSLCNAQNLVSKLLHPDAFRSRKICQKCACAPDPAGGAYSAPPRPLAGFKEATSKGGKGRWQGKGEGRGGKEWKGAYRYIFFSTLSPGTSSNVISLRQHPHCSVLRRYYTLKIQ